MLKKNWNENHNCYGSKVSWKGYHTLNRHPYSTYPLIVPIEGFLLELEYRLQWNYEQVTSLESSLPLFGDYLVWDQNVMEKLNVLFLTTHHSFLHNNSGLAGSIWQYNKITLIKSLNNHYILLYKYMCIHKEKYLYPVWFVHLGLFNPSSIKLYHE